MKTHNDYRPEVRSLIARLEEQGRFNIMSGNNGGEDFKPGKGFVKNLTAADDAWLRITRDKHEFSLYLVLGNCPGEIVNDVRCGSLAFESEAHNDLDNVIDAHFYHWEHKPQPTITV